VRNKITFTLSFAFSISAVSFAAVAPEKEAAVKATFSSMPLAFTENQGQWPDSVLYRASAGGVTMWFTPTGAYYQFTRTIPKAIPVGQDSRSPAYLISQDRKGPDLLSDSIEISMVKTEFVGSNLNASAMGLSEMEYKCNYFIGNEPDKWRTDVPNYESIQYQEVYPGIDLKYYGNGKQMEYDFIVSPGADYSKIQVRYDGAESLSIGENGELIIKIANGEIIEQPPIVHQIIDGRKENIWCSYSIADNNTFSFKVDSRYNPSHELVIDPVLVYSTFLGGGDEDVGFGIAVDTAGQAYVTGYSLSTNFPTLNEFQTFQGSGDVFVAKLSGAGNSLIYCTYLGGSSSDNGEGIAVDSAGQAYVAGHTSSTNFPTLNEFQTFQGVSDAFVAKLSSAGNSLVYSTYLGGSDEDQSVGIAVIANGAAYVTGYTASTDFPTLNEFQTFQGSGDVFVAKLSSAGNSLDYSTYLGGSGHDQSFGIAVNASGAAYVTGYTYSTNFPTLNPYQSTHQGGSIDVFVTKFSSAGNSLVYSTYLGGGFNESGHSITVDSSGSAYVTGSTSSTNFPTFNPYQTDQGGTDAYVTKLNSDGNGLDYSTYLGGSGGNEVGTGITVDSSGAAYVTGSTGSTNFPTLNPYQSTNQGGVDVFVTKLSSAGNNLIYSTYLGGSDDVDIFGDQGQAIAVDAAGSAYVAGFTLSTNFPTLNPYQTFQGNADAFVAKLIPFEDSDGDGVANDSDNCPTIANSLQEDSDFDGVGDACDNCPSAFNPGQEDTEGDGTAEACDNCPNVYNPDQTDDDADGLGYDCDNCPTAANASQVDADGDGRGDACDNCPEHVNDGQEDTDGDGRGNACDNCLSIANPTQINSDTDALGDACDNCPTVSNTGQEDISDGDGIGDACDNCLSISNPTQTNSDTDFLGDACDNCPLVANPLQEDVNNNGVGNACCCIGNRGDVNGDGADANILDLTFMVDRIFRGGPPSGCPKEADVNSNGSNPDVVDLTFLVDRIFRGGAAPGPC